MLNRRSLMLATLAPGLATADGAEAALWGASFATPDGRTLALASFKGQWMLLNFWATWCAPCVKEMPDIDRFAKTYPEWRVVGLAIDGPTPVREFLVKRPVGFAIGLAGLNGSELMRKLGNLKGGLPFTVIANPQGQVAWRRPGATDFDMLDEARRKLSAP
jgi:thiol-disulfide isomerase/thioredoxin